MTSTACSRPTTGLAARAARPQQQRQFSSAAPRPCQQHRRLRAPLPPGAAAASGSDSDAGPAGPLGVIIECDGALVDAHGEGHRVAFNKAFNELGHDCTNWTPAVFYDLMRLGDGTGEGVIAAYYGIRGWPMMLPSKERQAFVKNIHAAKVRILREMAAKGEVPLRQDVQQFIDDALAEGARIAVVAATASVPEDGLVSSAMYNLGPNRAFQLRVVSMGGGGPEEEGGSSASEDDQPPAATFEQQVAAAQAKAKREAAAEFVRVYNLQKASGMGMRVDPKIMTAAERAGMLTPHFMAALAASLDTPCSSTLVVAGGQTIMEAGKTAGMLTLGVPPSVAMRGGFSAADGIFDGYGAGGGLTWRKAKLMLQKMQAGQQARPNA